MRGAALTIATVFVLASCGDGTPVVDPALGPCTRLRVLDSLSGASLRGIEDISVDVAAGRAFLSAYDRWDTDDAVDKGVSPLPQGGIYVLDAGPLAAVGDQLSVSDASLAFKGENDLHPHGLDLLADGRGGGTLAVINRRYGRASVDASYEHETTLEIFSVDAGGLTHRLTIRHPLLCRANEVVLLSTDVALVSRDHAGCEGGEVLIEDAMGALGLYGGQVVRFQLPAAPGAPVTGTVVADGIGFANGLVLDPERRRLYVAATREAALLAFALSGAAHTMSLELSHRLPLPGGPDNLALLPTGAVLAAVHPDLWVTALYLHRWIDGAPSRVVSWMPEDGDPSLVWNDETGALMAAATVATPFAGRLLIGSVADEGLAVCPWPADE